MSGRKRALLRMNERDRKKLQNIESRLGSVKIDQSEINSKIEQIKQQVTEQIDLNRNVNENILNDHIAHLDQRIQQIEYETQNALRNQQISTNQFIRDNDKAFDELRDQFQKESASNLSIVNQFFDDYSNNLTWISGGINDLLDETSNQKNIAWQNLLYAQEVFSYLSHVMYDSDQFKSEFQEIQMWISTGWDNFQNATYQAALMMAQKSVIDITTLRFKIDAFNTEFDNKVLEICEKTAQIINLAENSQIVRAIDLEGNELNIEIDVNFWSRGLIQDAIQVLHGIQNDLIVNDHQFSLEILNELLIQTLPAWEQALHECVKSARIDVINAQTRYEVAKTVVDALTEQGFELENGAFEAGDLRSPYHVLLGNLEGSEVHISISPVDDDPLNYLMDINSNDSNIKTENELKHRARELLGSLTAVGLKVGQVYQAEQSNLNAIREISDNSYTTSKNRIKTKQK